jgi:hypothetical protein
MKSCLVEPFSDNEIYQYVFLKKNDIELIKNDITRMINDIISNKITTSSANINDLKSSKGTIDTLTTNNITLTDNGSISNLYAPSANINTLNTGNIISTGYIRSSYPGQFLNIKYISLQNTEDTTLNNNDIKNWKDVVSINYTPVSDSSTILIDCNLSYIINGSGNDSYSSQLLINNNNTESPISSSTQIFKTNAGSDTRSNVLFPLSGSYNNSSKEPITIKAQVKSNEGNDNIKFLLKTNLGNGIKIIEISR